jgi:hypothetical protein
LASIFNQQLENLLRNIEASLPEGHEKLMAITRLQECGFWINEVVGEAESEFPHCGVVAQDV